MFNMINSVLNLFGTYPALPAMACNDLLNVLVQKTKDIRVQTVPDSYDPSVTRFMSVVINQFTLSLQSLAEIIGQLKSTNCCCDIVP